MREWWAFLSAAEDGGITKLENGGAWTVRCNPCFGEPAAGDRLTILVGRAMAAGGKSLANAPESLAKAASPPRAAPRATVAAPRDGNPKVTLVLGEVERLPGFDPTGLDVEQKELLRQSFLSEGQPYAEGTARFWVEKRAHNPNSLRQDHQGSPGRAAAGGAQVQTTHRKQAAGRPLPPHGGVDGARAPGAAHRQRRPPIGRCAATTSWCS